MFIMPLCLMPFKQRFPSLVIVGYYFLFPAIRFFFSSLSTSTHLYSRTTYSVAVEYRYRYLYLHLVSTKQQKLLLLSRCKCLYCTRQRYPNRFIIVRMMSFVDDNEVCCFLLLFLAEFILFLSYFIYLFCIICLSGTLYYLYVFYCFERNIVVLT